MPGAFPRKATIDHRGYLGILRGYVMQKCIDLRVRAVASVVPVRRQWGGGSCGPGRKARTGKRKGSQSGQKAQQEPGRHGTSKSRSVAGVILETTHNCSRRETRLLYT